MVLVVGAVLVSMLLAVAITAVSVAVVAVVVKSMLKDLDKHRQPAVKAILQAADDPNAEVCVSAVETLGALSAEGLGEDADLAVKKLDSILRREGRKVIRDAAQAARDKLRPKGKE